MRRLVDPSEARHPPNPGLPESPCTGRPKERVIVEANRKKAVEGANPGIPVERQRARVVLGEYLIAVGDGMRFCSHVGDVVDSDERIGLAARKAHDAATSMVFERARERRHPVRRERAGDGVAPVGGVSTTLECETHGLAAVNQLTAGRWQPEGSFVHGVTCPASNGATRGSSTRYVPRTVSLRVSRSTMKT